MIGGGKFLFRQYMYFVIYMSYEVGHQNTLSTRLENEGTAETQPWKWNRLPASVQLAAMCVCESLSRCVSAELYVGCMSLCMMRVCQPGFKAPVSNRNAQSGSQPPLLGGGPIEARLDGK